MQRRVAIILLLIAIPFAVYWQTRNFAFVWDDEANVASNPYFNPVTLANLAQFWHQPYERLYIPVCYTVWAMIAALQGGGPLTASAFHTANLFLHILSTLVVFVILKMLFSREWAACAGALLFALHPIQVEAVSWITGMKDVLSGFLSLLALWQYLCCSKAKISLETSPTSRRNQPGAARNMTGNIVSKARFHYAAATTAFILALLAKPAAVILPLAAWALDCWALKRPAKESAVPLGAWLLLALPVVLLTRAIQPQADLEFITPLWLRPLIAADAMTFYFYKLLLPLSLAPDYGRLPEWVVRQEWLYFSWSVPAAAAILAWMGSHYRPWLMAAFAVFIVAILPVSGLVPFSFQNVSTVADRYLYIAMLGPALALSGFLAEHREKWWVAGTVAALGALALGSAVQTRLWQNNLTLFRHALKVNPQSWTAHYSLARALFKQEKHDEAIAHFREAARLKPNFTNAHFSLAGLLAARGEFEEAIAAYRQALKIDPNFADGYYGMGNALALRGDLDAAMQEYRQALKINPNRSDIYFSLANAQLKSGNFNAAAQSLREAIRISPDFVHAHNNLGRILAVQGDLNGAIRHFREALRTVPSFIEAHEGLALALNQQGKTAEAKEHLQEAQRLRKSR